MIIETSSPMPKHPRPIIVIGAGGIVNDAHLPAYKIAGFWVAGIYDLDREKALATAARIRTTRPCCMRWTRTDASKTS